MMHALTAKGTERTLCLWRTEVTDMVPDSDRMNRRRTANVFLCSGSTNSFLGVGLSSCLSRASWEVPSGSSCNVRGGYRFSTLCIFGLPRLALGVLVSVGSSQSEAARFRLLCTRSMILFSQDPWELKETMQSLGTDNKNSNLVWTEKTYWPLTPWTQNRLYLN